MQKEAQRLKLIVLDSESTARDGQICQLACLMIDGGQVRGTNRYFAVDSMDPAAQAVHGLSLDALSHLSGGLRFGDCAGEILSDLSRADLLIGHNISADLRMLKLEMSRLGLTLPPVPTLCTMKTFTPVLKLKRLRGPGSPKPPKLTELCAHYGIDDAAVAARCAEWFRGGGSSHDARFDAAATYLCLLQAIRAGDIPGDLSLSHLR